MLNLINLAMPFVPNPSLNPDAPKSGAPVS